MFFFHKKSNNFQNTGRVTNGNTQSDILREQTITFFCNIFMVFKGNTHFLEFYTPIFWNFRNPKSKLVIETRNLNS